MSEPAVDIPSVDWWITSRCNLACDFCYGPKPAEDPDLQDKILRALGQSSARVVTFCGGEPLLVGKIGGYAARLAEKHKSTVLNSNGLLLRQRLGDGRLDWKLRLADFTMVGISIDGSTPVIHERMRGPTADLDEVFAAATLVAGEPGVGLKIGTVVSSVNKEDLPALARRVQDLGPDIWRLYQYSSRSDQKHNHGQKRHRLADDDFRQLAQQAADLVAPVPTAPSTEAETEGCLIVDPSGNVLHPTGTGYDKRGNCLKKPLDEIWAELPARSAIVENKRWLEEVLGKPSMPAS